MLDVAREMRAKIERDGLPALNQHVLIGPAARERLGNVTLPEGLKLSREVRARKLGDLAPSSTYLVVAGLASPDYKVEIDGEAVGPE